jgi:hypothetical protein
MFARLRTFFARHPILRDAVLWAIPAVLFGAALRLLMLSYLPYAYWGSDSNSYYSFAHKLLTQGYLSLGEKRRFIYPLLMVPVSLLPGSDLKWLAWLQHGLGVVTLLPLAYVVRKCFAHWRLWIVPVTVIFAGMPMILWYEHELLGETLFFAALVWAFAGWVAWVEELRRARAGRLFWWFFAAFAVFLLTKPSGRFVWPGLVLGLLFVRAWTRLRWPHWAALGSLFVATLLVGSKKQGAWLLYVAVFPLTDLESPLHAEYKAGIRPLVEPLRAHLGAYHALTDGPFEFLEGPDEYDKFARTEPWQELQLDAEKLRLWRELDRDEEKAPLYMDLSKEALLARPVDALLFGWQRVVASANPSEFGANRFDAEEWFLKKYEDDYRSALALLERMREGKSKKKEFTPHTLALGYPAAGPLPSWEEMRERLSPAPRGFAARAVQGWVAAFNRCSDLVRLPNHPNKSQRSIALARPTVLGCWLAAGLLLSMAAPAYRRTLGVWTLAALAYLIGVFVFSQTNPRYFGPAWPILIVALAVPADLLLRGIVRAVGRRGARAAE